jgi:hypothetical protein
VRSGGALKKNWLMSEVNWHQDLEDLQQDGRVLADEKGFEFRH